MKKNTQKLLTKILFFCLCLLSTALIAVGCKHEKETYTVTFRQRGQADIVKVVDEGYSLTDIPDPAAKMGYTVVWEDVNLTNIKDHIIVNAIETANSYTITYDANGGTPSVGTQTVVYDSTVTLATATREGYELRAWTLTEEGGSAVLDGVWKIAENVKLVANWVEKGEYTVTFRQNGETLKIITLTEGTTLSEADVPTPKAKVGYTVAWNEEQLAAALAATEGNLTVDAVETVKTYTVTLEKTKNSTETKEVTYGEAYDFGKPYRAGYTFNGWFMNGTKIESKGTWTYDVDSTVTIKAEWTENVDDEDGWTANY